MITLGARKNEDEMRKPNLFIVGASKSGTTALHNFLNQHPDIFMSRPKELRFFCKDHIQRSDDYLKKNWWNPLKRRDYYRIRTKEEYLSNFAERKDEKMAGESSPHYLISEVAAREIHKFNPDSKIIIILRNPVDWLYSAHAQTIRSGSETVSDFEKAIALEKDRRLGKRIPKFSQLVDPRTLFYSERATFSKGVKRYLDTFDRKQIKIIIYDDFKKDNAKVYREVLEFLGVAPNFIPKFEHIHGRQKVSFIKLRMLWRSKKIRGVLRLPKYVLPKRFVEASKKLAGFQNGDVFIKSDEKAIPMDPKLRRKLMKEYKPEVQELSKLVGRDLVTLWGYDIVGGQN